MSESGPIWHITEPAPPYPDGRFDGPTHGYPTYPGTVDRQHGPAAYPGDLPSQPYEVVDTSHLDVAGRVMRPLDPQQPTPEDMTRVIAELQAKVEAWKLRYEAAHAVADAARDALADIETVMSKWAYPYPKINLDKLVTLYRLLRGPMPAPAWQTAPLLRKCGHTLAPGHDPETDYCWECEVIESDHDDYLLP